MLLHFQVLCHQHVNEARDDVLEGHCGCKFSCLISPNPPSFLTDEITNAFLGQDADINLFFFFLSLFQSVQRQNASVGTKYP